MTETMTDHQMTTLMDCLDKLSNPTGALREDIRARLFAVVDDPNQQTWDSAFSIIVSDAKFISLWQACIRYSAYQVMGKPSDGDWPSIPTRDEILNALEWAGRTYPRPE